MTAVGSGAVLSFGDTYLTSEVNQSDWEFEIGDVWTWTGHWIPESLEDRSKKLADDFKKGINPCHIMI